MRRLWAGAEAEAIGWGGVAMVARATGLERRRFDVPACVLVAPSITQ